MKPILKIKRASHRLTESVSEWREKKELFRVYTRFREFTMIKTSPYMANLRVAKRVANLDGCVVECGVWRGGMSAGLATVLGPQRDYFLFDSFEGLPPAKEIDGASAISWQKDTHSSDYHDNCAAEPEFAMRAMRLAGISSFHLHKGWFEKTVPTFKPPKPIALLRLDGDWYDSTLLCLSHLFDFVAPGGIVILDDYYTWDGCSRATHDFLSRRSAAERINNSDGICWIKKI